MEETNENQVNKSNIFSESKKHKDNETLWRDREEAGRVGCFL